MVLRFLNKNITIKSARMLPYHSNNRNNKVHNIDGKNGRLEK